MTNKSGKGNLLSETLQQLISEKLATGIELAELAGVSDSAVGRYVNNEGQPKFETVRQWIRHHPEREVKLRLAQALTAGTPIRQIWTNSDLDVNRDGKVDRFDALRAMVMAFQNLSETLTKVEAAIQDDHINNDQLTRIVPDGYQAIEQIATGLRVLSEISQQPASRRKAKPLRPVDE